jgi:hypothetical protein
VDAARRPRTLELEVSFDAEPIQGRLYDPKDQGDLDRPFSGWLGLISAIEAARGLGTRQPSERKGETL